jgi:two-component system NtrC family sensor kinase
MSATLEQELVELRRANTELRNERDAALAELRVRTAALTQRTSEYGERIEHQSAAIEVLRAMSASPGDKKPVFDLIVRRAVELCNAESGGLFEYDGKLVSIGTIHGLFEHDGELLHVESVHGTEPDITPSPLAAYLRQFPMAPKRGSISMRAILENQLIHIRDMRAEVDLLDDVRWLGHRSQVSVPLRQGGRAVGVITMAAHEPGGFSDSQIELLTTFAEQAVIAIGSAETYRALQGRTSDLQESLEYQTATSDVLKVISHSAFDLEPVLERLLRTAALLCDADLGSIAIREGDTYRMAANYSPVTPEYDAYFRNRQMPADRGSVTGRTVLEGRIIHVVDVMSDPEFALTEVVKHGGARTVLGVPLLREGVVAGVIILGRKPVQPFTDRQIELVSTFADQAVIAIENTRLLTEQREALEQQTATAEVLQVINASPGNLAPVFDTMLENALRLCGAAFGTLYTYDGEHFQPVAFRGVAPGFAELMIKYPPTDRPGSPAARVLETKRPVDIPDVTDLENYRSGVGAARGLVEIGGVRAFVNVPLVKDDMVLGFFTIYRHVVGKFSDKQIALLENFATQVVIAMESARLLQELRDRTDELAQRQAELRVTFENMGDGVAMFDETPRLVAWNRKFQDILDLPDGVLAERLTFPDYIRYLTERGEYGAGADPDEQIRRLTENAGEYRAYERTRPDGRVIEIRHNPVPSGGFVLIFSDITERKRNDAEIRAARDAAEEASRTIEAAFRDLKTAQANLIQAEKMASLGQLTAGIAHEIKNPLNFVNNFAALSVDLLIELKETATPGFAALTDDQRAEIEEVSAMLTSNLEKITEHGKRADGIVKAMLEHSRGSSGERRMVDLNTLIDEALNLAYHGARAQDQSFNITLELDFLVGIAPIEVNPQDMTRVLLNLFSNGFYAATRRARNGADAGFVPTLKVATRDVAEAVEIRVRDNGTGIPTDIRDKLFQPFFTTKPTGEGTGLGLSITYDIVTKAHGGSIAVDSKVGEYSEFTIRLPRKP